MTQQAYVTTQDHSSDYLDNLAHDLKQPLVAVANLLYLIQEDNQDRFDEQQKTNMQLCINECGRIHQMINQLQALSDISHMSLSYQQTRPVSLIEKTLHEFDQRIDEQNVKVNIVSDQGEWILPRELISQTLSHLIDNALQHGATNDTPVINIICAVRGRHLELSVIDNGHGITPMDQQRIFRPFYRNVQQDAKHQQNNKHHQSSGAAGMGLAIVRTMMHRIGGTVSLESQTGPGAHFKLRFPTHVNLNEDLNRLPSDELLTVAM